MADDDERQCDGLPCLSDDEWFYPMINDWLIDWLMSYLSEYEWFYPIFND